MKHILVAVDFSDVTERQLQAVDALLDDTGGKVDILHVLNPVPEYMGYGAFTSTPDMSLEEQYTLLANMVEELQQQIKTPNVDVNCRLVEGDTVSKILQEQEQSGAELIVVGSHGHGSIYDLLVGSAAEGVLHKAGCPVLVVPSEKE